MECKPCACCGQAFRPHPQVPEQRFCSAAACQRARKRLWQQAKRASDEDYRLNQARAQAAWVARHPDYWQRYRRQHPEYCERNRLAQRQRDRRRAEAPLAKMDACGREALIRSGTYRLCPVAAGDLAKMDAWTVEITLLSEHDEGSSRSCKERTS
ncbi:MAG TPA: hypothetical protein VF814_06290 [Casimicrobiaceae bacterium]